MSDNKLRLMPVFEVIMEEIIADLRAIENPDVLDKLATMVSFLTLLKVLKRSEIPSNLIIELEKINSGFQNPFLAETIETLSNSKNVQTSGKLRNLDN